MATPVGSPKAAIEAPSASHAPATDGATRRAVLSRELSEFLIEFSIGVHRFSMYPAGHPSLGAAAANVVGRLSDAFETRRSLSLGVANRQIVIEGAATDARHPVLAELARRLHAEHIGALSFVRGVNAREVEEALKVLGRETEWEDEPVGLLPPDRLPAWEHIRIHPVGYDQLRMGEGQTDDGVPADRPTQLWLGLAQAAMALDAPSDAVLTLGPNTLARVIEKAGANEAYDQVIAGYLRQLADELQSNQGGEAERIRRQVSTLISELPVETLSRLVAACGSTGQRQRFILDANQSLAVDAVVKIVRAAADSGGQVISISMTRMLNKLAQHATTDDGMRHQADTALREHVEEMMSDWHQADPNPAQYTAVLDAMARSSPLLAASAHEPEESDSEGALRVLQMALEVDAWGPSVRAAVTGLVAVGQTAAVLRLIESTGPEGRVADQVRRHLTSPVQLKKVLSGGDVEDHTLRALVGGMGADAIPPLLDVLAESSSRFVRRKVFDLLLSMGPDVARRAVARLADGRWFVLRNMLVLLQRIEQLPDDLDLGALLTHPDARVRREAMPLALRKRAGRERILAAALAEQDERMVRLALLELRKELPETLVPVLVSRVVRSKWSPEIRALGARVLGGSRSALALDALLGLCAGERSVMGRTRLAARSPEVLACLETLSRVWSGDPRAREMLALAASSKDPDIRRAVEPSS